jgi:hypothetical protein
MDPLLRPVIWTRRDRISLEYFELREAMEDVRLSGTIVTAENGKPMRVSYTVYCDRAWNTRSVRVALDHASTSRDLVLTVDDQHRWWHDGKELSEIAGCIDVDISLSPATNTLPIRRLSLAVGEERDVVAAWIRFPDLVVEPLAQRYARTSERLYRYSSDGGAFTADIEVDAQGLVVRYPPAWERASG